MPKKYKYSIICCARWESNYIGEWLSYYKEIGFDHIYVYCNDDDPTEFFDRINEAGLPKGFLTVKYFPEKGKQHEMYLDALTVAREESEWISFFDIDEFLDLKSFANISDYMNIQKGDVDCVYFNWLQFKTSGFISRPYGSVLRNYVYRDKYLNNHTKYICKASYLTEERIKKSNASLHHSFHHFLSKSGWPDIKIVNSLGDDWSEYAENFPHTANHLLNNTDQALLLEAPHIKHYHLRSAEDLIIRYFRSIDGDFSGQKIYFQEFIEKNKDYSLIDKGEVFDDSLKKFAEKRKLFFHVPTRDEEKRIVIAETPLWKSEIVLDFSNNSVSHLEHNTKGKFSFHDQLLLVYWDEYPLEIFIKNGNVFKSSAMLSEK